jgi:diguanylate cyclase (GGDEF)-like protein/putative nucleotidyltransferase with HDIG domain
VGYVGLWLVPVAFVPLYLTYRSYQVYMGRIEDEQRQVKSVANLHLATVEALARAIDARDQPSAAHLRRMQLYATRLAQVVGLPEAEIQAIKTAALLHDIGKLAVPEHILSKPGRLNEEEFQRVRIHSQVGADIIADVPFPSPVAPIILSHHERWDGKGYPQGLQGEGIPLGARILGVVDYFEAVTAERPYHGALPVDQATALIKSEAGRAFDPALVAAFVELLPSLLQEDVTALASTPAPASRSISASMRHTPAVGSAPDVPHNAYEHIAVAHREINALYEIAQAMSTGLGVADTMEIISTKLTKIVPWSGSALFLHNHETESLKCAFATGYEAVQLYHSSVSMDSGLCGWVARNRRTLVNADPLIAFQAAGIAATTLQSAIVCPLVSNDALIGVLALFHVEADRYTEEHRRLLERVADQAGTVLHNSIVFEQTQEDALTDSLTGLPNRRAMAAHFSRELARAERSKSEFALVVIDIDGFKAINDTHGHASGDWALREVATTLSTQLRPYDLCGRFAGDEFILVLTNCSREIAELRSRELQARISEVELRVGPEQAVRLAVSAGTAVFPDDGLTYDALLATADRRMYRDKTRRASASGERPVAVPYAQNRPRSGATVAKETVN